MQENRHITLHMGPHMYTNYEGKGWLSKLYFSFQHVELDMKEGRELVDFFGWLQLR